MQDKGLISEIEDLNRFNYVLVTRSSPSAAGGVDQDRFINDLVERLSSDGKSALTATNEKKTK